MQDMSHLPSGARQRLAARQLTGRLSKARNQCRHQTKDLWRSDVSRQSPRPGERAEAVLGRNALDKPGDCNVARHHYVVNARTKIKESKVLGSNRA